MGSTKAREARNVRRVASDGNSKLSLTENGSAASYGLPEFNPSAAPSPLQRNGPAFGGLLRNGPLSPPSVANWNLASARANQSSGGRQQSQTAAKSAARSGAAAPKITYKPGKASIPPMRPETQAIIEKAARHAGISSIKVSSTQETTSKHEATSNHYNRPGKPGTSADISEIDGQPVVTYPQNPELKRKVDAFQKALDQYGAHENFGPSQLTRDGKPVPQVTAKQKNLARQHHDHVHVDPPRRKPAKKL